MHYHRTLSAADADAALAQQQAEQARQQAQQCGAPCALGMLGSAAGGFIIASLVAKRLPPTAAWALGWGAIATAGTYAFFSPAAAAGIAAGYAHAYSHQTPFPKKK